MVVNPTQGLPLPQGHSAAIMIMSMKNSSDTIGNKTCDILVCSAVPKPDVPLCAPLSGNCTANMLDCYSIYSS